MAGITLEVAKKHLDMWLEAESQVAINQAYTCLLYTSDAADEL